MYTHHKGIDFGVNCFYLILMIFWQFNSLKHTVNETLKGEEALHQRLEKSYRGLMKQKCSKGKVRDNGSGKIFL